MLLLDFPYPHTQGAALEFRSLSGVRDSDRYCCGGGAGIISARHC